MQRRRRWLEAVAVSLQAVLLFGLGLAAWRSDPFGANREPEVFGGSGSFLPLFVLPALGLWGAYTLGRWFLASQRKSSFGVAVASLLALAYGCMLLGGAWVRATAAQETLTAAWIPWLVGFFLFFPIALVALPFAALATKAIPVGAAVVVMMTWWGYESLTIASSLNSVWTTAVAAAGWVWLAADSLRTPRARHE